MNFNVLGIDVHLESDDDVFSTVVLDNFRPYIQFESPAVATGTLQIAFSNNLRPFSGSVSYGSGISSDGVSITWERDEVAVDLGGSMRALSVHVANSGTSAESYQRSLRWGIQYPLFYMLGLQGIHVLHASSVDLMGSVVVLAGLAHVGKSTLVVALSESEDDLLGDNYTLGGSCSVFLSPETMRLSTDSIDLLPTHHWVRRHPTASFIHKKYHFSPHRPMISGAPKVGVLLSVCPGRTRAEVLAAKPEVVYDVLLGTRLLLTEFPEQSYLSMLPLIGLPVPTHQLPGFVRRIPWFEVLCGDLQETVDTVKGLLR